MKRLILAKTIIALFAFIFINIILSSMFDACVFMLVHVLTAVCLWSPAVALLAPLCGPAELPTPTLDLQQSRGCQGAHVHCRRPCCGFGREGAGQSRSCLSHFQPCLLDCPVMHTTCKDFRLSLIFHPLLPLCPTFPVATSSRVPHDHDHIMVHLRCCNALQGLLWTVSVIISLLLA